MSTVLLEDADSQLAQLVQQVSNGEEVIIVRDHMPIAKIVPLPEASLKPRRSGYGSGKDDILYMADDFDAPLEDFKEYSATE
jgi:antitoxin (DNA-binding transcriptional repressor) of toxin-antitoxin stability system